MTRSNYLSGDECFKCDAIARIEVSEASRAFRLAILDPSTSALDSLLADDLWYSHSSGQIDDKTRVMSDLLSQSTRFLQMEVQDEHVHVLGDAAVVRHRVAVSFLEQAGRRAVLLLTTQVWHQARGRWRLVARQATRLPEPGSP